MKFRSSREATQAWLITLQERLKAGRSSGLMSLIPISGHLNNTSKRRLDMAVDKMLRHTPVSKPALAVVIDLAPVLGEDRYNTHLTAYLGIHLVEVTADIPSEGRDFITERALIFLAAMAATCLKWPVIRVNGEMWELRQENTPAWDKVSIDISHPLLPLHPAASDYGVDLPEPPTWPEAAGALLNPFSISRRYETHHVFLPLEEVEKRCMCVLNEMWRIGRGSVTLSFRNGAIDWDGITFAYRVSVGSNTSDTACQPPSGGSLKDVQKEFIAKVIEAVQSGCSLVLKVSFNSKVPAGYDVEQKGFSPPSIFS